MYRFWDQAHPHHEAYDSCATSACGAHAVVTLWGQLPPRKIAGVTENYLRRSLRAPLPDYDFSGRRFMNFLRILGFLCLVFQNHYR